MTSSASPAPFEELASLRARVQQFESQIVERDALLEQREATIEQHEATIERLHEQVRLLLARRFGASSEKLPDRQLGLFNEAEAAEEPEVDAGTEIAAHRRARPVRAALRPACSTRRGRGAHAARAMVACIRGGAALVRGTGRHRPGAVAAGTAHRAGRHPRGARACRHHPDDVLGKPRAALDRASGRAGAPRDAGANAGVRAHLSIHPDRHVLGESRGAVLRQGAGDGVVVALDLGVVVDVDSCLLRLGEHVAPGRKGAKRGTLGRLEQRATRPRKLAERARVGVE